MLQDNEGNELRISYILGMEKNAVCLPKIIMEWLQGGEQKEKNFQKKRTPVLGVIQKESSGTLCGCTCCEVLQLWITSGHCKQNT